MTTNITTAEDCLAQLGIKLPAPPEPFCGSRADVRSAYSAPGALYEIKIDTNGDAIADICYSVQFASSEDGKQAATVRRAQGGQAVSFCDVGEVIVERAPVSVAREALVTN